MNDRKSVLAMLAGVALMGGMMFSPIAVPRANAQADFHLGWQQPPQDFNDVRRQGFHAGMEAARHDLDHGMPPDPHRHGDFRRPHLPPDQRQDFREGFRRGYEVAYQHRGDWNHDRHDWDNHDGGNYDGPGQPR